MKTNLPTSAINEVKNFLLKTMCLLLLLCSGMALGQIVNIPDPNFKAALLNASSTNSIAYGSTENVAVDSNGDGEIQYSEAATISGLQFQSYGIVDFTGIESFVNLASFGCYSNPVTNFNLNGLLQLQSINIDNNIGTNTVFSFSNLPALNNLSLYYSNISSLSIDSLSNLTLLNIWNNASLTSLHLFNLTALDKITANNCAISDLIISNSPQLTEVNFNGNHLSSIAIASYPLLKKLYLDSNLISDTSLFSNLSNLEELNIQNNQIANLQLPALPALKFLTAGSNGYPTINLSGFPNLRSLSVNNNALTTIDFSATPLIQQLNVNNNALSVLNVSNLPWLNSITCSAITATELDFSSNPLLQSLNYFNNPNLTHINLKSGTVNSINYNTNSYYNLPNLQYICIDEGDTFTYSLIPNPPTVPITSYCTFTPGGTFNTISGTIRFDANNNGCDANDISQPNLRVDINDGTIQGATFTSTNGNYNFYTQAGSFDLQLNVENPTWFTFSPTTATIPFVNNNNNSTTQNFCISANGVHNDVEVVIAPIIPARPGFDATYKIVYKNKGNQTLSGNVAFNYNDAILHFVSSTIVPVSQLQSVLIFDYTNLLPFESRSFYITMHVNSPTDSPAVTIGDVLNFTATINPVTGDDTIADNQILYNQTVVGAFDPNSIACLEGAFVSPSQIGSFLHYGVNFENTGNYPAQNIVVKVVIDTTKYDVNTLQLLNTSSPAYTRINGNVVEFIFQNIILQTGGHGDVLFKIKTLNSLSAGDVVSKRADIFFDYNTPIDTGMANTTFQVLNNGHFVIDNSIVVAPNPTSSIVTISSNASAKIQSIQVYDVQGRLIATKLMDDLTTSINLSDKTNGIYFLKITSDKGSKVEKMVKK